MTYNTEGIILRYRDIGEYDRIYSVLTRDHGKVDAWAQGVRKSQSKLVAHLQPLYLCDFMFARGRRFDRVAQVRVLNRWALVWSDLEKIGQATYAASLVDLVLRPGTKEGKVFELIKLFLNLISIPSPPPSPPKGGEGVQGASPLPAGEGQGEGLLTIFSLKLLKESGFAPELRNCVVCKGQVEGLSVQFDAQRGGVVCPNCHPERSEGSRDFQRGRDSSLPAVAQNDVFLVSSLTLETLEQILGAPLNQLEMPEAVARELKIIAEAMIRAHFEEEPKARLFVDALAKEPLYAEAGV